MNPCQEAEENEWLRTNTKIMLHKFGLIVKSRDKSGGKYSTA